MEGSVGVRTVDEQVKLTPGEQASFSKNNNLLSKRNVDPYDYTAWKDGKFVFTNESLDNIMRKLGRWYNVETIYANEALRSKRFSGTVERYNSISAILSMISLTTNIDFKIDGRTITASTK